MPYLRGSAVRDARTRPEHLTGRGTVLPWDHPFRRRHYPPNDWRCRCAVQQLGEDDLERFGLIVSDGLQEVGDIARGRRDRHNGFVRNIEAGGIALGDSSFTDRFRQALTPALEAEREATRLPRHTEPRELVIHPDLSQMSFPAEMFDEDRGNVEYLPGGAIEVTDRSTPIETRDDVMDLSLCGVAFLWESSPASEPHEKVRGGKDP